MKTVLVIIGRLLVGYAVGTITGVAPVFGAEIAKVSASGIETPCLRGMFGQMLTYMTLDA
jgi:hypothetical protein